MGREDGKGSRRKPLVDVSVRGVCGGELAGLEFVVVDEVETVQVQPVEGNEGREVDGKL